MKVYRVQITRQKYNELVNKGDIGIHDFATDCYKAQEDYDFLYTVVNTELQYVNNNFYLVWDVEKITL